MLGMLAKEYGLTGNPEVQMMKIISRVGRAVAREIDRRLMASIKLTHSHSTRRTSARWAYRSIPRWGWRIIRVIPTPWWCFLTAGE